MGGEDSAAQEELTLITLEDLSDPPAPVGQGDWNNDGVVILKNAIPEDLMVAYEECWLEENRERPMGWPDPIPYTRHTPIIHLLLCDPIVNVIEELLGEPGGLHLNLTGWRSTERNWHQDTYLNPPHVGDAYAAVWLALDTIHPDSGPFQYIPGSHRWRVITQEKVLAHLPPEERDHKWPKYSEKILDPIFDSMVSHHDVVTHLPSRGDVLIWNGRLLHRGSPARVPDMERRAVIAHYSGIHHRPEMPEPIKQGNGYYFPLETDLALYYGDG